MEEIAIEILKDSPIAVALIVCMFLFLRAMQSRDKMFTEAIQCNERALDSLAKAVARLEVTVERVQKVLDEG